MILYSIVLDGVYSVYVPSSTHRKDTPQSHGESNVIHHLTSHGLSRLYAPFFLSFFFSFFFFLSSNYQVGVSPLGQVLFSFYVLFLVLFGIPVFYWVIYFHPFLSFLLSVLFIYLFSVPLLER